MKTGLPWHKTSLGRRAPSKAEKGAGGLAPSSCSSPNRSDARPIAGEASHVREKLSLSQSVNVNELARFFSKVDVRTTDECWPWTAALNEDGYGVFRGQDGGNYLAHRFSYAAHIGDVPAGLCVCHSCDNPPCVNYGHFFLGTQIDNLADMRAKGRGRKILNAEQVREIRAAIAAGSRRLPLCRKYGVSDGAITAIISGETWGHVT